MTEPTQLSVPFEEIQSRLERTIGSLAGQCANLEAQLATVIAELTNTREELAEKVSAIGALEECVNAKPELSVVAKAAK